jgi:hypothetical protein
MALAMESASVTQTKTATSIRRMINLGPKDDIKTDSDQFFERLNEINSGYSKLKSSSLWSSFGSTIMMGDSVKSSPKISLNDRNEIRIITDFDSDNRDSGTDVNTFFPQSTNSKADEKRSLRTKQSLMEYSSVKTKYHQENVIQTVDLTSIPVLIAPPIDDSIISSSESSLVEVTTKPINLVNSTFETNDSFISEKQPSKVTMPLKTLSIPNDNDISPAVAKGNRESKELNLIELYKNNLDLVDEIIYFQTVSSRIYTEEKLKRVFERNNTFSTHSISSSSSEKNDTMTSNLPDDVFDRNDIDAFKYALGTIESIQYVSL